MAIMLTVTDRQTNNKFHLTDGMIKRIQRNTDGTAYIELENENVTFNSVEPFDWILLNYGKLI
jgi:hypothetical protein